LPQATNLASTGSPAKNKVNVPQYNVVRETIGWLRITLRIPHANQDSAGKLLSPFQTASWSSSGAQDYYPLTQADASRIELDLHVAPRFLQSSSHCSPLGIMPLCCKAVEPPNSLLSALRERVGDAESCRCTAVEERSCHDGSRAAYITIVALVLRRGISVVQQSHSFFCSLQTTLLTNHSCLFEVPHSLLIRFKMFSQLATVVLGLAALVAAAP